MFVKQLSSPTEDTVQIPIPAIIIAVTVGPLLSLAALISVITLINICVYRLTKRTSSVQADMSLQNVQAASHKCADSELCTINNSAYDCQNERNLAYSLYDYIYNPTYNCEKIPTEKNSAYNTKTIL